MLWRFTRDGAAGRVAEDYKVPQTKEVKMRKVYTVMILLTLSAFGAGYVAGFGEGKKEVASFQLSEEVQDVLFNCLELMVQKAEGDSK